MATTPNYPIDPAAEQLLHTSPIPGLLTGVQDFARRPQGEAVPA
ncbi:MAG: hypothetical protein WAT39_00530 [Planctomycetota bacterium]